jgi:hypothetical protein
VDATAHRLIVGTSADAVARHLACGSDPADSDRFRRLRSLAFPEARTFFCLDLSAAAKLGKQYRERLTRAIATKDRRPAEAVSRDLDQVIELARLFDAVFISTRIDAQASTVRQTMGLVVRQGDTKSVPTSRR